MECYGFKSEDRPRNYFPLPNAVFYLGLTTGALAVYAYLLFCEDRKTHKCYPSYKTIGKAVGMSANTVRKYVYELLEKELIEVEPTKVYTKTGRVWNGNLMYRILPIQQAVDCYNESQLWAF